MNLYFLLEGKRTEPKVYRAWLKHAFPHLTEVKSIDAVQQDNCLFVSGFGYPSYMQRIDESIEDINRHGAIDHFLICVDAEEDLPETKREEIEKRIAGKVSQASCQIVVQNCCMETWFLGNKRMLKRNPTSERLREWKAFYDVSINCPESMPCHQSFRIKAHFHLDYFKEMLRERNQSYSKTNPGVVLEESYWQALKTRHEQTNHLQSFGHLLTLWRSMGGNV